MSSLSVTRYKGKKIYECVSDYTVFDLETTGFHINDSCKIIEISALRVRNDYVEDVFTTLVNPQIHIPGAATKINHITDEMVESAPIIENVFDDFLSFIGDDILVGHNIDTFDYNLIYDVYVRLKGKPFQNQYIDTYNLSRIYLRELPCHKLADLANHLNIEIHDSHRAEADCYTTYSLYKELKPLIKAGCGHTVLLKESKNEKIYGSVTEDVRFDNVFKDSICIVYGAFENIDTNNIRNIFTELGAECVDYLCYSAKYLILGDKMFKKYIKRVPDELIDGVMHNTNVRIISEHDFIRLSNIIISSNPHSLDIDFACNVEGKKICLTGEFATGSREELENTLIAKGAVVKSNVIKTLDYLIIGKIGSPDWKDGKGSKLTKAEKYNNDGCNIEIIEEHQFIKGVKVHGAVNV